MIYGHDKTIHQSKHLDVETHNGKVVAVWFRCAVLPFEQIEVDESRAEIMIDSHRLRGILAVEFEDLKPLHQLSGEGHRYQVTTHRGDGTSTLVTFEGLDAKVKAEWYLDALKIDDNWSESA